MRNSVSASSAKALCDPSSLPRVCICLCIWSSQPADGLFSSKLSFHRNQSASLSGARSTCSPSASSAASTPLSSSVRQSGVPTAAMRRPLVRSAPISLPAVCSCSQPGRASHCAEMSARLSAGAACRWAGTRRRCRTERPSQGRAAYGGTDQRRTVHRRCTWCSSAVRGSGEQWLPDALQTGAGCRIDTSNYTHGGKEQATVFSAVKASIDNNLPIIIRLNSSDGKKTHFVTAIAYTGSCSSASSISVIDPAGGVIRTLEEAGTARNETVYGDYIATARRS